MGFRNKWCVPTFVVREAVSAMVAKFSCVRVVQILASLSQLQTIVLNNVGPSLICTGPPPPKQFEDPESKIVRAS